MTKLLIIFVVVLSSYCISVLGQTKVLDTEGKPLKGGANYIITPFNTTDEVWVAKKDGKCIFNVVQEPINGDATPHTVKIFNPLSQDTIVEGNSVGIQFTNKRGSSPNCNVSTLVWSPSGSILERAFIIAGASTEVSREAEFRISRVNDASISPVTKTPIYKLEWCLFFCIDVEKVLQNSVTNRYNLVVDLALSLEKKPFHVEFKKVG